METMPLSLQILDTMHAHQCSAEAVLPTEYDSGNVSLILCIGNGPLCFSEEFHSNDYGIVYASIIGN